jgi:uncharacterized protein YndB with AHSA1/START domain
MSKGDPTKFIKRISIKANPQMIYDSWATPAGLESWFLRLAEFKKPGYERREISEYIQAGDKYFWLWHGYDDETFESRSVLQANGKDLFQFEFTGDCIVTISILHEAGETICQLTQENIPSNDDITDHLYVLCGEGWTFYMTNLKSILEGGIDLRNKNIELKQMINA